MGTAQVKAEPQGSGAAPAPTAAALASITRDDAATWADGCAKLRPDQNATLDCQDSQVKIEAPVPAAAAPAPTPAAISRAGITALVNGCGERRDATATDDYLPTSIHLIRCLRAGELVTEPVPREFGASYAW